MCVKKSIEDNFHTSIRHLTDYIKKSKERLIATRNKTNNTRINRTTITRKQKYEEKQVVDISSNKQAKYHTRRLGHG